MSMTSASVARDLKYAARIFSRSYISTIVTVLTLGLAIGVNTAIFSLAYGIPSFDLPFQEANRLAGFSDTLSKAAFQIVQNNSRTMDAAAYSDEDLNLTVPGHVRHLKVSSVSANFFSVLRVSPAIGRVFQNGEDNPGRDNLVILSYRLWQREFNSEPGVVGRTIQLGGLQRGKSWE